LGGIPLDWKYYLLVHVIKGILMAPRSSTQPVISNMMTDYLDFMIRENLDGVYFIAGQPVMFRREYNEFNTPQFPENLEDQDILDCLEALGFETDRNFLLKGFTYRSDFFPDMRLTIDINPQSTSKTNNPTYVHVRFSRFKKAVIE
jgi:hypothetical protein